VIGAAAAVPVAGVVVGVGVAPVAESVGVPFLSPPLQAPRTTALATSASLLNRIVKASK
jgi:hypothetical protein